MFNEEATHAVAAICWKQEGHPYMHNTIFGFAWLTEEKFQMLGRVFMQGSHINESGGKISP